MDNTIKEATQFTTIFSVNAVDELEAKARQAVDFVARIKALQRDAEASNILGLLGLKYENPATINDQPKALVPTEAKPVTRHIRRNRVSRDESLSMRILSFMAKQPPKVYSAQQIRREVKGHLASIRSILAKFVKDGLIEKVVKDGVVQRNLFIAAAKPTEQQLTQPAP